MRSAKDLHDLHSAAAELRELASRVKRAVENLDRQPGAPALEPSQPATVGFEISRLNILVTELRLQNFRLEQDRDAVQSKLDTLRHDYNKLEDEVIAFRRARAPKVVTVAPPNPREAGF